MTQTGDRPSASSFIDRMADKQRRRYLAIEIAATKKIILGLQQARPLAELAKITDIDTKIANAGKSKKSADIVQGIDDPTRDYETYAKYVEHTSLAMVFATETMSAERLPILLAKVLNISAQAELEGGNLDISDSFHQKAEEILEYCKSDRYTDEEKNIFALDVMVDSIKKNEIAVSKSISKYAAEIAKKEVHGKDPNPNAPGASTPIYL